MRRIILLLMVLSLSYSAKAQFYSTPDTTYFQGFLTDDAGAPLDAQVPAVVSLFTDNQFESILFNGMINVVKGYFSIPIKLDANKITDLRLQGKNLFIELEVSNKKFSPRIYIGSVPIAKVAQTADSSLRVRDSAITDIKVADNAAIKGSKILPDFGNNDIKTGGAISARSGSFDSSVVRIYFKNIGITELEGTISNPLPNSAVMFDDSVNIKNGLVVGENAVFGNTVTIASGGLNVTGNSGFDGNIAVNGNSDIGGDQIVGGNSTVQGNASVVGNLDVGGASTVAGNQSVGGSSTVTGSHWVNGNVTILGTEDLRGALSNGTSIAEPLRIADSLFVQNGIYSGAGASLGAILDVRSGGMNVSGKSTLNGGLVVSDSSSFARTLTIEGKTQINDSAVVNGTLDVSGKLTVTNGLEVTGTVKLNQLVTGDVVIGNPIGNLTVNGNILDTGRTIIANNPASILSNPAYNDGKLIVDGKIYTKDITIEGGLKATAPLTLGDSLTVNGPLTANDVSNLKNTNINGKLDVTGATTLTTLNASGAVDIGNNLYVKGNLSVDGWENVVGIVTLQDVLNAGGDINASKNVNVDGTVNAKGKVILSVVPASINAADNLLYVDGKAFFKEATISGALILDSIKATSAEFSRNLYVGSAARMFGTLTVDGATNLNSAVLAGNLTVNGNTNVKALTASGDANFTNIIASGNLSAAGNSTLGNLTVTGNSTLFNAALSGNLSVVGASTLNTLTASGDVSFERKLKAKDQLIISPNADFITTPNKLYVDGKAFIRDLDIAAAMTLTNDLTVNGTTNLRNTNITGNLGVTGTSALTALTVSGQSDMNIIKATGSLDVTGPTTLNTLTASGVSSFNAKLKAKDQVIISPNADFIVTDKKLYAEGKAYIGELEVNTLLNLLNALSVQGNTSLKNTDITGVLSVNGVTNTGTLNVTGASNMNSARLTGNLDVVGGTNLNGLSVAGTANLTSAILTSNLSVAGTSNLNILNVSGNSSFNNLTSSGNFTLSGNERINGTLTVDNEAILKSKIRATDQMIISPSALSMMTNKKLYVEGSSYFSDIEIGGTMSLSGPLSLLSTLTVAGNSNLSNATLSGNLIVTGSTNLFSLATTGTSNLRATSIVGNLDVSGQSSLSTLLVNGMADFNNMRVSGNLDVNGTLQLSSLEVSGATTLTSGATLGNFTFQPASNFDMSFYSLSSPANKFRFFYQNNAAKFESDFVRGKSSLFIGNDAQYHLELGKADGTDIGAGNNNMLYLKNWLGNLPSDNPTGIVVKSTNTVRCFQIMVVDDGFNGQVVARPCTCP